MNQYLNFSLEGKVALVTGASYGIGFAIASAFAEQGATICFNDINQELVDKGLASYAEKESRHTDMYAMLLTNLPYRLWLPLLQRSRYHRYSCKQCRYYPSRSDARDGSCRFPPCY